MPYAAPTDHDMRVAYNDNDPFVCAWLAELIKAGELPEGDLFQGSIKDLNGEDLKNYGHIHLFSGISGWPLGLRLAGWPSGRRVLTGSCPCQPYSVAGKRGGDALRGAGNAIVPLLAAEFVRAFMEAEYDA